MEFIDVEVNNADMMAYYESIIGFPLPKNWRQLQGGIRVRAALLKLPLEYRKLDESLQRKFEENFRKWEGFVVDFKRCESARQSALAHSDSARQSAFLLIQNLGRYCSNVSRC